MEAAFDVNGAERKLGGRAEALAPQRVKT